MTPIVSAEFSPGVLWNHHQARWKPGPHASRPVPEYQFKLLKTRLDFHFEFG
jgi:hypothetical protein